MGSISVPTAILGAGAIGGVGSLASGIIGSNAAQNAAQVQAQAADYAAQLQFREFGDIRKSLAPYLGLGRAAINPLESALGIGGKGGGPLDSRLLAPLPNWHPTMHQLQQTPGYRFALNQGLQATQNSYASQGLGSSVAAEKGAAQYATGLASTTYEQQFQNYLLENQQRMAQRGQIFNMLSGVVGSGQNAAALQGGFGQTAASNAGQYLTSAAAAQAGGIVGSANSITNALGGLAGAGSSTALLMALNNAGMFGGGVQSGGMLIPGTNTPISSPYETS